jgi:CRISPR/Cas system CSM-associated protein Csm3 (group 7 of RAMP superfamily)
MMVRHLEIRFQAAFHHGSGFGIAGLVDRAVVRDSRGIPYLAGSAIKGKFRHAALRLLFSNGERPCEYGGDPQQCAPCALCLLFGSRLARGALVFSDAWPDDAAQEILGAIQGASTIVRSDSHVRPGIALDRGLGTTRGQLLFSTETLPAFMVFHSQIKGEIGDEKLEELIRRSAQVLTHFGAGSSRGLGNCEYVIREKL